MLKSLLDSKKCFKLVCGAGNENTESVKRLVKLYYEAGCRFFDVSFSEEIIKTVKEIAPEAYVCVSTGIKGDPHMAKAKILTEYCQKCEACSTICPQNAVKSFNIDEQLCIGCLKCVNTCKHNAINIYDKSKDLSELFPAIKKYNPDCVEIHAIGEDEDEINKKWEYINENFCGTMSLCIDRSKLSNEKILARVKRLISTRKPYSTIIQADGAPMSGGKDDYKTTLQAVAMAEIIQNANLPVHIMLSGGTNSKTLELAKLCGLDIAGVAIGSYARSIVKEFLNRDDFWQNEENFNSALSVAKTLVDTVNN